MRAPESVCANVHMAIWQTIYPFVSFVSPYRNTDTWLKSAVRDTFIAIALSSCRNYRWVSRWVSASRESMRRCTVGIVVPQQAAPSLGSSAKFQTRHVERTNGKTLIDTPRKRPVSGHSGFSCKRTRGKYDLLMPTVRSHFISFLPPIWPLTRKDPK